ncbi:MAG: DUF2027 domain-containing protein [Bacteroidota bacterium]
MTTRKFNIGDSVRFLNETGGGVISAIISHDLVMVSVENDFEFEFQTNQLVLVNNKTDKNNTTSSTPRKTTAFNDQISGKEGLFLAFTKEDDTENPTHHIYLVNNTNFMVLYAYNIVHKREFIGVNTGVIVPVSKHLMQVVKQNELDDWNAVSIDAIFYQKGFYKPLEPVSKLLTLNISSFTRAKNFKKLDLLDKEGFVFSIWMKEEPKKEEKPSMKFVAKDISEGMMKVKEVIRKPANEFPGMTTMEVDLHIEELIDDIRGMSNAEIIKIQLRHFDHKLNEAITNKMRSIVFIHGIGKGVLKNEIISILDTMDGITYSSASMQKYGNGATEVFLY